MCDGRAKGSERGAKKEPAGRGGSFLSNASFRLWAPARDEGDFGLEGPKVAILGTSHKQIAHAKAGYRLQEGPVRTTQVF